MAKIYNNSKKHKTLFYPKAKVMGTVATPALGVSLMSPFVMPAPNRKRRG